MLLQGQCQALVSLPGKSRASAINCRRGTANRLTALWHDAAHQLFLRSSEHAQCIMASVCSPCMFTIPCAWSTLSLAPDGKATSTERSLGRVCKWARAARLHITHITLVCLLHAPYEVSMASHILGVWPARIVQVLFRLPKRLLPKVPRAMMHRPPAFCGSL